MRQALVFSHVDGRCERSGYGDARPSLLVEASSSESGDQRFPHEAASWWTSIAGLYLEIYGTSKLIKQQGLRSLVRGNHA